MAIQAGWADSEAEVAIRLAMLTLASSAHSHIDLIALRTVQTLLNADKVAGDLVEKALGVVDDQHCAA
ncbi:hypothetical protein AB0395_46745 [Streptosporangium sp. NPDC051023]|uniref:hypothetical protein n=1 Tax=Streptosporangium sp. NPDC051023 TaxID=3155410 RepID=UPI00344C04F4